MFISQWYLQLAATGSAADIDTLIGVVTDVCTDCLYFIYFLNKYFVHTNSFLIVGLLTVTDFSVSHTLFNQFNIVISERDIFFF